MARAWSSSGGASGSGVARASRSSRSSPPTLSTWSATTTADQPLPPSATVSAWPAVSGRHSASFSSSRFSSVIGLSSGSDCVVVAVEGKRGQLPIDQRRQVDGAPPDELDVGQRVGGLIQLEVHAGVSVLEKQLAAVTVVPVYYIDPWFSEVSQAEQQPLLDF